MKSAEKLSFPIAPEEQVTLANWRKAPFNKWSFSHVREIVPSAQIAHDPSDVRPLPPKPVDLSGLSVESNGVTRSFGEVLDYTDTDALVVLHRGALVHETYTGETSAATPHILMSVSKSILGLMMGILEERGAFSLDQKIEEIIPEVSKAAFAGATLREILDMRVGIRFEENYAATGGAIIAYRKAQGWDPILPGEEPSDLRRFFEVLVETDGAHGGDFHYVSPNTDLLGWVVERATGRRYSDLVTDLLWKPLGAQHDAYITVDRLGAPRCAGGVCTTARDLARIGQLFIDGGRRGDTQVVPSKWIEDIVANGDRDAWDAGDMIDYFPGLPIHYRSKWYVLHGETPIVFGLGVHGQNVFVDPANEIVVAKFSSQAVALDAERIAATLATVEAIRDKLTG